MKAEYVDHMGTDLSVVNAARVSFDKTSDWEIVCDGGCFNCTCAGKDKQLSEKDTKLIKYLAKHNHWTPFAHTAISLRMAAPVPIRTQCFKHKQGLVENEESRRYIDSRPVLYVPDAFRSRPEGSMKQGSGDVHPDSDEWLRIYKLRGESLIDLYEDAIESGIAPEQARLFLPQGVEVNWIWTGNVFAFANFYNKRTDFHAQKEIQDLAKAVGEIIEPLFPVSWKALTNV